MDALISIGEIRSSI